MNTRINGPDWDESTTYYSVDDEFEIGLSDLSDCDENALFYETDAANDDFWDVICDNDEEWEAATTEGFLIF